MEKSKSGRQAIEAAKADLKRNFKEYLNKSVNINSHWGVNLKGELIEIDDPFLVIQHRGGRRSRIRQRDVSVIYELGYVLNGRSGD